MAGKIPPHRLILLDSDHPQTLSARRSYLDAVEEALCFGWIDARAKRRWMGIWAQRLSPRAKGSKWSELNKETRPPPAQNGIDDAAGNRFVCRTWTRKPSK